MSARLIPYFKFFTVYGRIFLGVMVGVLLLNQGLIVALEVTKFVQGVPVENNLIEYVSYTNVTLMGVCFVHGILCACSEFSTAISIRGNRKGYLQALILWIIGISILVPIISVSTDYFVKFLIEMVTGYDVMISNETMLGQLSSDSNSLILNASIFTSLANMFFNYMAVLSIGCALGALGYRLRKMTGTILLIVVPTVCILVMNKFSDFALSCIGNPMIMLGIKCVTIICCLGLTVGLLIKAPIKEYAHDLM